METLFPSFTPDEQAFMERRDVSHRFAALALFAAKYPAAKLTATQSADDLTISLTHADCTWECTFEITSHAAEQSPRLPVLISIMEGEKQ